MRSVFGKYLALCFTGIILEAIILIVVLIQTFRFNSISHSLFRIIMSWKISLGIFSFIVDWAEILSVLAVCLVLIAFFANFRKYRKSRALSRLHEWAKNAVLTLADYRQEDTSLGDPPLEGYEEIRALMDKLKARCHLVLADAQVLGGELDAVTKRAVHTIFTIDEKVRKQDESVFEDIRPLQHYLAEVMIATFESLQVKKQSLWHKETGQGNQESIK
jgi:hypothetical protein